MKSTTIKSTTLSILVLTLVALLFSTSDAFVQRTALQHRPAFVDSSTTRLRVIDSNIDSAVEAELCTTLAHVALDFTGLVSPSRSIMRLFTVIGRVFAISADYLPDHSIHTEEIFIQGFLLTLALRELLSDRFLGFNATESKGQEA